MVEPLRDDLEARLYRAALYLCPPAFRREFGAEMLRDIVEAGRDADIVGGLSGIWAFRARICADFARTLARQWWRTGLPAIAVLAMTATFVAITSLDQVWRHTQVQLPIETDDRETIMVVILATLLVAFVTLTIALTQWVTPRLRRHTRMRHR